MAGISYSDLVTKIRSYSEVDSNVLTTAVLENIILNAQYRIMRDIPIDADRKIAQDNLVANQEHANVPAGALVIRAVEVADSTAAFNNPIFLEKRDMTFLDEFNGARVTGRPKYYAMKGGATGNTNTTSGAILLSPIPNATYVFKFHYNAMPATLESSKYNKFYKYKFSKRFIVCLFSRDIWIFKRTSRYATILWW